MELETVRAQARKLVHLVYEISYRELQALVGPAKLNLNLRRNMSHVALRNATAELIIPRLMELIRQAARTNFVVYQAPMPAPAEPVELVQEKIDAVPEPTIWPVFVRAVATLSNGVNSIVSKEKYFNKIDSKEQFLLYKRVVLDRFFTYDFTKSHPDYVISGIDFIIDPIFDKQTVQKVRDYHQENCVINLLRSYISSQKIDKIYEKFPELVPTDACPRPELSAESMSKIGKNRDLKLKFKVYSALGAYTHRPWMEIGTASKGTTIPVRIACEHATMIADKMRVQAIKYHDTFILPDDTNVADFRYNRDGELQFYTTADDGCLTVHKNFKPSSITNNTEDDDDLDFAKSVTADQVLYKIFKKTFNLVPNPDHTLRTITKKAENFIGHRRLSHIPTDAIETDHNKNYISYELLPEYRGFPTNNLIPTTFENAKNPAFIIATVTGAPSYFYQFYGINDRYVLPRPTYDWLKNKATIDPEYVLDHPTDYTKISIVDFADKLNIDPESIKKFRNTLIGRTITGGINETRTQHCNYKSEVERSQMIYECQTAGYRYTDELFDTVDVIGCLTVEIPDSNPGLFNFHSYILSYAAIHMMQKWHDLESSGATIHAYNVDALVFTIPDRSTLPPESDNIGGWKYGPVKDYYNNFPINKQPKTGEVLLPSIDHPAHPTTRTLLLGPGGIGKSHPFLNTPHHDQVILTPTKELRDAHKRHAQNPNSVYTAAKYFQFGVDKAQMYQMRARKSIPRQHNVLIIDEFTMFTEKEWVQILDRADNSLIIALGDFEQIAAERDDQSPITKEFLVKHGFTNITLTRDPNKPARHAYEYGKQLDSLRGKSPAHQLDICRTVFETTDLSTIDVFSTRVITGTHARAQYLNMLARDKVIKAKTMWFPVKDRKNELRAVEVDHPSIWWGRKTQKCEMPKLFKYEPAFARTADSIQGRTIADQTLIVDGTFLTRKGTLYTAVTRTTTPELTKLLL